MTDGPRILVDYQSISEVTGVSSTQLKEWSTLIPQMKEDLNSLRDELARRETSNNDDEGLGDNEVDEEPGIAMEDQLRIKEQSAKAIEIYTSTLLSSVWQGCSKSTYGELWYLEIMIISTLHSI
jgi:hypothetical protein